MGSLGMYEGADYGLKPKYGAAVGDLNPYFTGVNLPSGRFGFPSNPQTANQIDAVSKKISTGTRVVEVSGVSIGGGPALDLIDNIPKQHFKEINRLKKLAGVDLTFHGPLVEPTGVGQGNWSEQQRQQAERQMFSAVERAHDLDPKGNVVVTFHASNGLPEAESVSKDQKTGKPVITSISVIDEKTGRFGALPKSGTNYFLGDKEEEITKQLDKFNETNWSKSLSGITIEAERAQQSLRRSQALEKVKIDEKELESSDFVKAYYLAQNNPKEYSQHLKSIENASNKDASELIDHFVNEIGYGKRFAEESYLGLQDAFNQAYGAAKIAKDDKTIKKLEEFRGEIAPLTEKYQNDPEKLSDFIDEISKGIRLLNSVKAPEVFRPIKEFAIDKASQTFSGIAYDSYKQFKDSSPIISIENPPVGMGLSRADELNDLVKASRNKFVQRAVADGMSEKDAEKQAEKLIGVTWDVGHINMIRKHGFTEEDTIKETAKVAKNVKHIHLSDNFGLEHTELPMGMGNVPIAAQEKVLREQLKGKFDKVKQIVETGAWFRNFNNVTPFAETLSAFGSAIYPMKMSAYWNQTRGVPGGYFSGYGRMLPEKNFSIYGAGFSTLPAELGGQVQGGSNRLSGAPME